MQTVANLDTNKRHYDSSYGGVDVAAMVEKVRHVDRFLDDATVTDASWVLLYHGDFRARLRGARVLELGAGTGLNALVMAALGAHVLATDISEETPRLVRTAAAQLGLASRIDAVAGDFVTMGLPAGAFDFVVGKAFLHHLTHEVEDAYLRETARVLRPTGEARFMEPAVNSRLLDALRWLVPVPGRPSRLHASAWAAYKAADPHPERDNSSRHYREAGLRYFDHVETVTRGGIDRLHRFLPKGELDRAFRRFAYRAERVLPHAVRHVIARGQVVILRHPRADAGLGSVA
ncbi:MAG TPA: class I SAM-dependent methyltransferase [Gemmatimonadaceae bacterium]|nr:class I SAM-dependent methyltransferase [Gemmatimonadaceae bacterium]